VLTVTSVTKILPGSRTVLNDVSVSFLVGAKIGVVGPNGAGKSTLLKLLAGEDKEFDGEIWSRQGLRIGYLAQEPELDSSKSVHENIMDGLKHKTDLVKRFNELSAQLSEPDVDMAEVGVVSCSCSCGSSLQGSHRLLQLAPEALPALAALAGHGRDGNGARED
jgi:ATPase subunit of ABC transporter with duplicated ATPase domains